MTLQQWADLAGWLRKHLSPSQLCVTCLVATLAFGYVFSTRYVKAGDFSELKSRVDLSAQLQLAAEIRAQTGLCQAIQDKEAIRRIIEQLQSQYRAIAGERYPVQVCS